MVRVGVVGATGYGGRELIRLLGMHPQIELVAAVELEGGKRLDEVLPAFTKLTDLVCETFDPQSLAKRCDVVFLAVPGAQSMKLGADLRAAGARVLDMGPDFRLKNPAEWLQYYKKEHVAPELLEEAVYGMVPYMRDQIRDAQLVAVPGCYPISVILPLRPLAPYIDTNIPVVVDAISGVSGAGRALSEGLHFPEMNENVKAYKLAVHQHTPEIEQEVGGGVLVQFTPHIGPYTRGILSTMTVRLRKDVDPNEAYACYRDEPFVRVRGEGVLPEVRWVRGSTFCDMGWVKDSRTGNLLIVGAVDNLLGGTSGMAMQCFNIMFGFDERTGLTWGGMAP